MLHYGDITKISGYDVPIVDCVIGGSPCQDLSVAGKRAGLEGERSGLFMEQIRITKEMRERDERNNGRSGEHIRPRFLLWENVPGAFSSNRGEDFRIVLEEIAKVADKDAVIPMPEKNKWNTSGCIVGDGWSIAWRILDAQFWGVPQRRRRIALVADFGGECAQEILFIRKSLRGDSEESGEKRKGSSANAQGCVRVYDRDGETSYSFEPGIASREGGHIYENVSGTLRNNMGDNQMTVAYEWHNQDSRIRGPIDIACTLNTNAGDREGHLVLTRCYDIGDRRRIPSEYTDISPTLLGQMGTGGNNVPVVIGQKSDANYLDVEMEVAVRKYEVDCEKLCECLRTHKSDLRLTNKRIAEQLDRSITEVEHWFRNDECFSIPSPNVWYELKELLGIKTEEFDRSITEFEYKGGNYDMRNRIYVGETSPTLKTDCGNSLYLVPCVAIDRSVFNQGINALYNIGIDEKGVAFSHIAKGPGAVCYIDTSHADDVVRTDNVVAPLQARDYKGGKYVFCVDQGGGKSGANVTEGLSPTLTCTHGGEPVICLQGNGIDRADTAGCNGKGWKEGTCYTLNTIDRPAVVYNGANITSPINKTNPQIGDVCHTLTEDSRNYLVEVKPHYIVRRLTPLECERLQGFPDGWTDIGEYIDSKGKKKKASDSARYKALGNSIALPPWKWVIKRLCSHYERDATMASLFDGIGGFPLIWEQINGKGSCLWASEIEDFPIAVTKARIE